MLAMLLAPIAFIVALCAATLFGVLVVQDAK